MIIFKPADTGIENSESANTGINFWISITGLQSLFFLLMYIQATIQNLRIETT